MPQYGKPTGRDTIENLLKRVDELENLVKRLSGSPHRSTFDRGDTASVADPIEGQTLIQYTTETPHYYSNGSWRTFGTDAIYATSPQVIPILFGERASYHGFSWGTVQADGAAVVPGGWIRTNGGVQNSYLSIYVTLGPKGSHWALIGGWKHQSDGGIITCQLASITESAGVLSDTQPGSYQTFGTVDTYAAATAFDGSLMGDFIIDGADGTLLTAFSTGGDGEQHMDGGSGVYDLKLTVTTKNASSSGYRGELYALAFVRMNDSVDFIGGF